MSAAPALSTDIPSAFDGDVLLIRYADLGGEPAERLGVLATIGRVIALPRGSYSPHRLRLSEAEWTALGTWLRSGAAEGLLKLEGHTVRVLHSSIQHVIVGTLQLVADLATTDNHPTPQRSREEVWAAAARVAQSR